MFETIHIKTESGKVYLNNNKFFKILFDKRKEICENTIMRNYSVHDTSSLALDIIGEMPSGFKEEVEEYKEVMERIPEE